MSVALVAYTGFGSTPSSRTRLPSQLQHQLQPHRHRYQRHQHNHLDSNMHSSSRTGPQCSLRQTSHSLRRSQRISLTQDLHHKCSLRILCNRTAHRANMKISTRLWWYQKFKCPWRMQSNQTAIARSHCQRLPKGLALMVRVSL